MPYNKLRTLVTVVDCNGISAAARQLHRTQSAISQQLRALEEELDLGLLDRRKGRLLLTSEGERVYEVASECLKRLDEGLARIRHENLVEEGSLRIGAVSEFANQILTPRLGRFRARYPRVALEVVLGPSERIEQMLLDNTVDVGLLVTFRQRELFEARTCATETCVVVASKRYVRDHGPLDTYRKIAEGDIVDFAEDFTCMAIWMRKNAPRCISALTHRRPAVTLRDHHGLAEIVRHDGGIALLPELLVERDLRAGRLVQLMPRSKPVFVGVDVAVRKSRRHRRVHRLFLDFLAEPAG